MHYWLKGNGCPCLLYHKALLHCTCMGLELSLVAAFQIYEFLKLTFMESRGGYVNSFIASSLHASDR